MNHYKVGDIVRVAPATDEGMAKAFLNYSCNLHEANNENDPHVMLGGKYKILKVDGRFNQLIIDNENQKGMVSFSQLIPYSEEDDCPFKAGDKVKEIRTGETLNIYHILNKYYLFFDEFHGFANAFPKCWQKYEIAT